MSPHICLLTPGTSERILIEQMTELSLMIALLALPEGGLLIHGALAERDGSGVILAAPGGTGKTTASNRLSPPWHSLSDDATLVVRDAAGRYWAHPWPTWSRFRDNGPGGSWPVETAVPLAAIFFLSRSEEDRAEPVDPRDAAAYVVESIHQTTGMPTRPGRTPEEVARHCGRELTAAAELAGAVPVFRLEISLTGAFWEAIDTTLRHKNPRPLGENMDTPAPVQTPERTDFSDPGTGMFGPGHIPVIYSGPSMNPTLLAPDLLDVLPYGTNAPAAGDIICFSRQADEQIVVHRIIRIAPDGITTQGDNNPAPDPGLLKDDQVLGRVIGATRGKRTRTVAGGTGGRVIFRWRRTCAALLQAARKILRHAKPAGVMIRAATRLLPVAVRPRIVFFTSLHLGILRLYFGRTCAGEYNPVRGYWVIRLPFRLLVNERELPALDALKRYCSVQAPSGHPGTPL